MDTTTRLRTPRPPRPPSPPSPKLRGLFWVLLAGFLTWDFSVSAPVDLRNEPPLIAAGSGQSAAGGHCSMAK
jgi:hypothetical protein